MQILSGGLFLGAIFMATDYVTSPITNKGKVIYAIGCGIITVLIRQFGSLPEGVSFSILLMNILTPHIENLTTPKTFGAPGKEASK
jgi:electron transport complex protein RnfD